MQPAKQLNQVKGARDRCPNFCPCTLCYGCRHYDSRIPECRECWEEGKGTKRNFNVCNTDLHTTEALNKMKCNYHIDINKELGKGDNK